MMHFFLQFLICIVFCSSAFAAAEKDTFEDGANAFVYGHYEEAERILRKHERTQPSAVYLLKLIAILKEKEPSATFSYNSIVDSIKRGDVSKFDNLGMIARFSGEISGLSGTRYVQLQLSSAKRGKTDSQFLLGLLHQEGIGVQRNYKIAANWFENAASTGSTEALNSLGLYYRFGIGVNKDEQKAAEYLKKAVLKKNINAFYNYAQMMVDKKDFAQGFILSEIGLSMMKKDTDKKKYLRMENLNKTSEKKLTSLQQAYLEKFLPSWLDPILTPEYLKGRLHPEKLPMPPVEMVDETPFMKALQKDPFDNRYKKFAPLMPNWVPFDATQQINPALTEKTLPSPVPDNPEVIQALYFRRSDPRYIQLTLTKAEAAIPLMVGDIITVTVYTPLLKDEDALPGQHKNLRDTAYKISQKSRIAGTLQTDNKISLKPITAKLVSYDTEAWLSQNFSARKPGVAVISFTPQDNEIGKDAFTYTLKVVISEGLPPK